MNFILDTHTFIWFINGESLPARIAENIKNINNRCFISIASIWEIAIKTTLGKLTMSSDFDNIKDFLFSNNIEIMPITFEHVQYLIKLPYHHNDPFDRLIIAQGVVEKMTILSKDQKFRFYEADVEWD